MTLTQSFCPPLFAEPFAFCLPKAIPSSPQSSSDTFCSDQLPARCSDTRYMETAPDYIKVWLV